MFFKRIDKAGRERYYRANGKQVAKAVVKKSKKKVVFVPTGNAIPERIVKAKKLTVTHGAKRKTKKDNFGRVLGLEMFQQQVTSRINFAFEKGQKVGVKYEGKIYEVSKKAQLDLIALWESLESEFMEELAPYQDSPTMTLGVFDGKNGAIFDFDNINWFGNDEDGELFEELSSEYPEFSRSIKKIQRNFKKNFEKFTGKNPKK